MLRALTFFGLSCLAACGDFPTVGETTSGRTEFPELLPIADLLDAPSAPVQGDQDPDEAMQARIAALQARAERIRQTPF